MSMRTGIMITTSSPQKPEIKSTRRDRYKPTAMSAASMGKALVLIATSCAALSNQPASLTRSAPVQLTRIRLSGRLGNRKERAVALNYRDSDEDQPITFRVANDKLVASAFASKNNNKPTRWISVQEVTSNLTRPYRSNHDKQQENMDEYLEYVEKRYSRIHRRSSVPKQQSHFPGKALISTFVLQSSDSLPSSSTPQSTEDDPLNALGLSSLASARLRQRLTVPREFRDEHSVLTFSSETVVQLLSPLLAMKPSATMNNTTKIGGRLAPSTSLSFTSQFQLMFQTLKRVTEAFVTVSRILANFTARAIPKIIEKGGFRHSIRMASAVSFAILFMFRPLFRGAMKNTPSGISFQV
mmetsp:Transcript_27367/g.56597  ORF Transcript_27367/g.56597 Transcript_27367/m.56597 type:complete len:355 (-) Transcript_27367:357-1421(-)